MSELARAGNNQDQSRVTLELHPYPETVLTQEEQLAARRKVSVPLQPNPFANFNKISALTDPGDMHQAAAVAVESKPGDPAPLGLERAYSALWGVANITAGLDPVSGHYPLGFTGPMREEAWKATVAAYPNFFSEGAGRDKERATLMVLAAASAYAAGIEYAPETITDVVPPFVEAPVVPETQPGQLVAFSAGALATRAA
jgi:hypothetical protein